MRKLAQRWFSTITSFSIIYVRYLRTDNRYTKRLSVCVFFCCSWKIAIGTYKSIQNNFWWISMLLIQCNSIHLLHCRMETQYEKNQHHLTEQNCQHNYLKSIQTNADFNIIVSFSPLIIIKKILIETFFLLQKDLYTLAGTL